MCGRRRSRSRRKEGVNIQGDNETNKQKRKTVTFCVYVDTLNRVRRRVTVRKLGNLVRKEITFRNVMREH